MLKWSMPVQILFHLLIVLKCNNLKAYSGDEFIFALEELQMMELKRKLDILLLFFKAMFDTTIEYGLCSYRAKKYPENFID